MNTESSMFIGHKIKKLRELKNLTQEHMASQLEMTQSDYSRIENNEVDLAFSKLEKIADVLELKPEDIISFDEKYVFNVMHNQNGYGLTIHNSQYSEELKKLSDKVAELEALIKNPRGKKS